VQQRQWQGESRFVSAGPDLVVIRASFAGLAFHIDGLAPRTADVVHTRFAPPREDPVTSRADAVALMCLRADEGELPRAPTAGVEETFALTFAGERVAFAGRLSRGWFAGSNGEVTIASHAADDEIVAVVENVLRIVAAQLVLARGGLLLHSAAIARDADHGRGEAIVLVGRSGAGKSTACRTARAHGRRVLSDELNALFFHEGELVVAAVPFAGDFGEPASNERFRVRGLYLLEQGNDTVTPVSSARAGGTLLSAAPFVNADPARTGQVLDTALALTRATKTRALALTLGADAWGVAEAAQ
jgi:hypothetical protein